MAHLALIHIYIFKGEQKDPSSHDQDWPANCFQACERIKDTFKLKTKPPRLQLADRQVGWEHGQGSMENSWLRGQRETRPQRPEGLCGPLFCLSQRDDFTYVGADGARLDLSAGTKVWIRKRVPHSSVPFVLTERWALAHKSLQRRKGFKPQPQKWGWISKQGLHPTKMLRKPYLFQKGKMMGKQPIFFQQTTRKCL